MRGPARRARLRVRRAGRHHGAGRRRHRHRRDRRLALARGRAPRRRRRPAPRRGPRTLRRARCATRRWSCTTERSSPRTPRASCRRTASSTTPATSVPACATRRCTGSRRSTARSCSPSWSARTRGTPRWSPRSLPRARRSSWSRTPARTTSASPPCGWPSCAPPRPTAGVPVAYVNAVGGQDELVFDGGSLVVDADGRLLARGAAFAADELVVDIPAAPARPALRTVVDLGAAARAPPARRGCPRGRRARRRRRGLPRAGHRVRRLLPALGRPARGARAVRWHRLGARGDHRGRRPGSRERLGHRHAGPVLVGGVGRRRP